MHIASTSAIHYKSKFPSFSLLYCTRFLHTVSHEVEVEVEVEVKYRNTSSFFNV